LPPSTLFLISVFIVEGKTSNYKCTQTECPQKRPIDQCVKSQASTLG
jgi:hypothetical protein